MDTKSIKYILRPQELHIISLMKELNSVKCHPDSPDSVYKEIQNMFGAFACSSIKKRKVFD